MILLVWILLFAVFATIDEFREMYYFFAFSFCFDKEILCSLALIFYGDFNWPDSLLYSLGELRAIPMIKSSHTMIKMKFGVGVFSRRKYRKELCSTQTVFADLRISHTVFSIGFDIVGLRYSLDSKSNTLSFVMFES